MCASFETNASIIPVKFELRDFSDENFQQLRENMCENFFPKYRSFSDYVNEYMTNLENFLTKLQNKYFPIRTKTQTPKGMHSPWLTTAIVKCIQKKT